MVTYGNHLGIQHPSYDKNNEKYVTNDVIPNIFNLGGGGTSCGFPFPITVAPQKRAYRNTPLTTPLHQWQARLRPCE